MNLRISIAAILCGLMLAMGLIAACADDSAPPVDAVQPKEAGVDSALDAATDGAPEQDAAEALEEDAFVWPDQGEQPDVWPHYPGVTGFGCQDDSGCFGQRCCPTPWGVKLCAATCPTPAN